MNAKTKMIVTTNTGDNDCDTMAGTLGGSLKDRFLLDKYAYNLVMTKAMIIPINNPCPPR